MKILIVALLLLLSGCRHYHYHYKQYDETGAVVAEKKLKLTFMLSDVKAADLNLETSDGKINIGTVDASVNEEAVKAISEGVTKAVIEGLKISSGIPVP